MSALGQVSEQSDVIDMLKRNVTFAGSVRVHRSNVSHFGWTRKKFHKNS